MERLFQDFRYGLRMLRKSPGFTLVAILTLTLGIGANTAIFSIVNAVLLQPLPFPQSDRLLYLSTFANKINGPQADGAVSYPDFFDWRSSNHVFSSLASYHDDEFTLVGNGQALHLPGETVSADFFSTLGVQPALGRGFTREEEKPGVHVVVLSHELWESAFGANREIIGQSITLNQMSYRVVGVMPAGFAFPLAQPYPKLWRTFAVEAEIPPGENMAMTQARGAHFLNVVGRMKDGVSLSRAKEDMNVLVAALSKQYPDTNKSRFQAKVVPELEYMVGDTRAALLVLVLSVGCVLLIACVNVANLLLARATTRSREIAVRSALGAARGRLVRQLLTESLLLSLGGAILALPLASFTLKLFLRFSPLPRMGNAAVNGPVILFTVGLALATSIIFGLAPALRSANPNLLQFMKEGARGTSSGTSHQRLRSALVIAETSIGLVLLVTAGLLLRSFHRLLHVDPGFNPDHVLTFNFDLPEAKYNSDQQIRFYDDLLQQLKALPGVTSASGLAPLPLSGDNFIISFQIEGRPVPASEEPSADTRIAGPDLFRTLGIPLISGRDFNEHDDMKATRVVIVNEAFAKRFFPNENPLGQRITPGLREHGVHITRQIIGVVGNVRHKALSAEFTPEYYLPYSQSPGTSMVVCLRTSGDPASLTSAVRSTLAAKDPDVPVYDVKTMQDYVASSVAQPRLDAMLLEGFAALALILTTIGIYGVVAYSVVQRTQEIGIRMTLGAARSDVLKMVLSGALRLVSAGVLVGLFGAVFVTRFFTMLNGLLFQVKPLDAITFVSVTAILAAVSLLASYIPALRATRVDPMTAVRYE
jgi:putative ABC transport system permease protein